MENTNLIRDTISHLTDVQDLLAKLGPLKDAHAKTLAEHEDAKAALESIKKELSDARSGLTVAQLKHVREYEESIFEKAQQAKSLDAKIAGLKSTYETKAVEVQSIAAQHKQLSDSLTSLRKQHFG